MSELRMDFKELLAEINDLKATYHYESDPTIQTLDDVARAMREIKQDCLLREVRENARKLSQLERKMNLLIEKMEQN